MRSALFCVVTQRVVVNPYRPLKLGQIGCPETSASPNLYKLHNNTEERGSHLQYIAKEVSNHEYCKKVKVNVKQS